MTRFFFLVKCWALSVAVLVMIMELAVIIYFATKDNGTSKRGDYLTFVFHQTLNDKTRYLQYQEFVCRRLILNNTSW